ncbi:MAG: FtsB family cell division protein [Anaerorhabdus sp.]
MSDEKKRVVKKVRKKRRRTPFTLFLCLGLIAFSIWLFKGVIDEINTMAYLKNNLDDAKSKLKEVQEENDFLISQKEKLKDPNYVKSYARGNYMLTKEGEEIFYLPTKDK